ncbi:MAG: hypothetical protein Q8L74_10420 [Nitrospirota bacterium]|nr:hypothetical protein [Nitrospirota bacterium]MDP2383246.1 hypothetical protein [Nitrospirota bacterium]MDP3599383.1 hypothetical protein [Nitrospirota bacterium]
MELPTPLTSFPDILLVMTERASLRYAKQPLLYAVHGPLPAYLKAATELVLEDNSVTICRGTPPSSTDLPASLTITPVYRLDPHGPLAVPTGHIYIRFTPGIDIEERRNSLADCGYAILQVPNYAPHTAWIRSTDGNIATSLQNIERLHDLPDLVQAEPQLLMQQKTR